MPHYVICLALAGSASLVLDAAQVAAPSLLPFLPIGGTSFNQTAVLLFFAVAYASIHPYVSTVWSWVAASVTSLFRGKP